MLFCLSHAKPGHAGPEGGGPRQLPSPHAARPVLPLPAAHEAAAAAGVLHPPPPRVEPRERLRSLRPRRRSPPWHQRALPPRGRRHGHRWRRSGVYVKDAASPGGRRRPSRRRRRPAEAALVNWGLGEPRMEVAVAVAAAGRALRRAGGKGGRGRGGPGRGLGRGVSGAAAGQCPGRAVARPTGPRAEARLPRAPVAGVRSVEPLAPVWEW